MTDADMVAIWKDYSRRSERFGSEFDSAVYDREASIPGADDHRLAELVEVAIEIDCYYGTQSEFLAKAAREAARRLRVRSKLT